MNHFKPNENSQFELKSPSLEGEAPSHIGFHRGQLLCADDLNRQSEYLHAATLGLGASLGTSGGLFSLRDTSPIGANRDGDHLLDFGGQCFSFASGVVGQFPKPCSVEIEANTETLWLKHSDDSRKLTFQWLKSESEGSSSRVDSILIWDRKAAEENQTTLSCECFYPKDHRDWGASCAEVEAYLRTLEDYLSTLKGSVDEYKLTQTRIIFARLRLLFKQRLSAKSFELHAKLELVTLSQLWDTDFDPAAPTWGSRSVIEGLLTGVHSVSNTIRGIRSVPTLEPQTVGGQPVVFTSLLNQPERIPAVVFSEAPSPPWSDTVLDASSAGFVIPISEETTHLTLLLPAGVKEVVIWQSTEEQPDSIQAITLSTEAGFTEYYTRKLDPLGASKRWLILEKPVEIADSAKSVVVHLIGPDVNPVEIIDYYNIEGATGD